MIWTLSPQSITEIFICLLIEYCFSPLWSCSHISSSLTAANCRRLRSADTLCPDPTWSDYISKPNILSDTYRQICIIILLLSYLWRWNSPPHYGDHGVPLIFFMLLPACSSSQNVCTRNSNLNFVCKLHHLKFRCAHIIYSFNCIIPPLNLDVQNVGSVKCIHLLLLVAMSTASYVRVKSRFSRFIIYSRHLI